LIVKGIFDVRFWLDPGLNGSSSANCFVALGIGS
jgi:hypothetical protein